MADEGAHLTIELDGTREPTEAQPSPPTAPEAAHTRARGRDVTPPELHTPRHGAPERDDAIAAAPARDRHARSTRDAPYPRPLAGYAALLAAFGAALGGFTIAAARRRLLPRATSTRDLLLAAAATHVVARLAAKDVVTSPLRAPFVEPVARVSSNEVKERPRGGAGEPLTRAVGELVTCPFCLTPWVAAAWIAALALRPRPARFVASVFATVGLADVLHHAYARVKG